ncbi:hypothetical protein BGZ63DRAFT_422286 [Mariannaea sp. PMI_226]|nr:hypothetical protein BGZ63DRAFT_422286 [Mariannaea sp. PMI_226]
MGYPLKALEPGNLYMTISLPPNRTRNYEPNLQQDCRMYIPEPPDPQDPGYLEAVIAQANTVEDFQWGLYYHRGLRDGTWYTLQRVQSLPDDAILGITHPMFELKRREVQASPRLDWDVIGLVRLMKTPFDVAGTLTSYLDWLTPLAAMQAQQTYLWATSVYFRTRRHVLKLQNKSEYPESVTRLLEECLEFAYSEVWYALGRQLPRPIFSSAWAYAPLPGETEEEWEMKGKMHGTLTSKGGSYHRTV